MRCSCVPTSHFEPALLISHHESAAEFPDHHSPTTTVRRLKPQQAVDRAFQTWQDALCHQGPDTLNLSIDNAGSTWLPIAVAAVPSVQRIWALQLSYWFRTRDLRCVTSHPHTMEEYCR